MTCRAEGWELGTGITSGTWGDGNQAHGVGEGLKYKVPVGVEFEVREYGTRKKGGKQPRNDQARQKGSGGGDNSEKHVTVSPTKYGTKRSHPPSASKGLLLQNSIAEAPQPRKGEKGSKRICHGKTRRSVQMRGKSAWLGWSVGTGVTLTRRKNRAYLLTHRAKKRWFTKNQTRSEEKKN